MKKYMKVTAICLAAVAAALSLPAGGEQALPSSQSNVQSEQTEKKPLYCTVLGDSIAKGYSADKDEKIQSYGEIAAEQAAKKAGKECRVSNYAENGLDAGDMNREILSRREVLRDLGQSDLILISIGSNDLLNQYREAAEDILGTGKFESAGDAGEALKKAVKNNPFLIFRVTEVLRKWDIKTFEETWKKMMQKIEDVRKKGGKMVVNNLYNPAETMKLPGALEETAEELIGSINKIIDKYADKYRYSVADLADSEVAGHMQSDGVHPDQKGQKIIAKEVYRCLCPE